MLAVILTSWALFLGVALMMLGNGLQGSLLGLRAATEGFATGTTGLVMSCYFIGFLAGSTLVPRILRNVGHVRVFSALASMASVSALIHGVFVEPITWAAMRLLTGFCFAGLYIVAESWINERATNETRGQLLSFYMLTTLGGMACGQLLLNVASPEGMLLFVLSSVLVSCALVPISLTTGPAPAFDAPSKLSLFELYRISPLGIFGAGATGMAHGTLFGMGAVFAERIGLSVTHVSLFMGVAIFGGILCQWPIGRISDAFDRRYVLTIVTFLAAGAAVLAVLAAGTSLLGLFIAAFLFGGMTLPMYSLCIAHANDHLEPSQIVAASSSLVLIGGIGASLGPTMAAAVMSIMGPPGFFVTLAGVHLAVGAFAIYRMGQREAVPIEEQGPTVPVVSGAVTGIGQLSAKTIRNHMDHDLASMSRSQMRRR